MLDFSPPPHDAPGIYEWTPGPDFFPEPGQATNGPRLNACLCALLGARLSLVRPNLVYCDSLRRMLTADDFELRADWKRLLPDRIPPNLIRRDTLVYRTHPGGCEAALNFFGSDYGFAMLNGFLSCIPQTMRVSYYRKGRVSKVNPKPFIVSVLLELPADQWDGKSEPMEIVERLYDGFGYNQAEALAHAAYAALYERHKVLTQRGMKP